MFKFRIILSPRKIFRIRLRYFAIFLAFITTLFMAVSLREKQYTHAIIFAFGPFLSTLIEFIISDIITNIRYPARTEHILVAWRKKSRILAENLRYKLDQIIYNLRGCDLSKINATIHLVVDYYNQDEYREKGLVQIIKYVGQDGGPPWRIINISKGIVGRCIRTRSPEWVNFPSLEQYDFRMVHDFGFTLEESKNHTKARSYYAHPIAFRNEIIGVLYLFSTEPQVFPVCLNPTLIDEAASDIANILSSAEII